MRTFVQKPKATHQSKPAKATKDGQVPSGQSSDLRSILHLQRTIGNQAVQRLLRSGKKDLTATIAGSNHLIQRRILVRAEEMDEDEQSAFIQSVREQTLMALNRGHRETLFNHPRLTERILHEMSSASTDYTFRNQAELIAYLAEDIGEVPTDEESRQLAEITELARLPFVAHRRWCSLDAAQRSAVLWEMGRQYGPAFAQQFRQYADSGRADYTIHTGSHRRIGIMGRSVIEAGFQFAGNEELLELWVHPSGMRALIAVGAGEEEIEDQERDPVRTEEEPLTEEEDNLITMQMQLRAIGYPHGPLGPIMPSEEQSDAEYENELRRRILELRRH